MALALAKTPPEKTPRKSMKAFLADWDETTLLALEERSPIVLEAQIFILEKRGRWWAGPVPLKARHPKQLEFPADITHRLTPDDLWFHPM